MASGTVLLIIDLQVGVLVDCYDAMGVVERTATLVDRARDVGVSVVWVQDHGDFVEGTLEWSLAQPLAAGVDEPLVRKCYRDAFVDTDLADVLAALSAERLVVAGAQTDYCIRTTTQAAAVHGYDVTLVSDGDTTTDAEFEGTLIRSAQIVAHTNLYFRGLRYPDRRFDIATHDEVEL